MAVMYKLYQDKRESSSHKGQWYARAIMTNTVDTKQLAERIQRNCTVKIADVVAVLSELTEVMKDELQASHAVKLDGFGIFRLGLRTAPAVSADKFTVPTNVLGYRVNFLPAMSGGGKGQKRNRQFIDGVHVMEAPKNAVDTTKKVALGA